MAELVWGFSCQVVVLVCCRFFFRSGKAVLRTRRLRSGSRRDDDLRQGLPQLRRLTVPVCGGSEGSSPLGADLAPHTCIRSVRLDPDHDAVMRIGGKAPGGGPILSVGINAMFEYGFPPPRIGNSAVVLKSQRERRIGNAYPGALACWTQDDALQGLASRDKAPECDHQLACQGDDHRLARAETAIGSAGAVPQCQCALLLKQQEAPGELDHAAADPGVAGSGEPLFPPLGPALVRRASQTGVARHCFSVTRTKFR